MRSCLQPPPSGPVPTYGAVGVGFASISNGYRYTVQKGCDTLQQAIWDEQVKAGLIVGGGFEYAFTKHFVGRGEYLYADYGSVTLSEQGPHAG